MRHTLSRHRRLDRAIQYAETFVIDPRSRGVLDTRFRGYDTGRLGHKR
jgi:hypothetical protein